MKILDLPLKKEWYKMIESGIKTEEYREIKEFWIKRFLWIHKYIDDHVEWAEFVNELRHPTNYTREELFKYQLAEFAHFTHVRFRYGYTRRTMLFELKSINIGIGNPKWGAPEKEELFILKLGEKINELSRRIS